MWLRWFTLLLVLSCWSGNFAQAKSPSAEKRWLQHLIHQTLWPNYQKLAQASTALHQSLQIFCQTQSVQDLKQAQEQWLQAYRQWGLVAPLNWGPTALARAAREVAFRPTRLSLLEAAIAESAARDPEKAAHVPLVAKGFFALEYLLFEQPPRLAEPARCDWAKYLGAEIEAHLQKLAVQWHTFAQEFESAGQPSSSSYPEVTLATEEVINLLIAFLQQWHEKNWGPLKTETTKVALGAYSQQGKVLLNAQLQGLKVILLGSSRHSESLAQYLKQIKQPRLSKQLRQAFGALEQSFQALPENFDSLQGQEQAFLEAVQALQTLLEDPIAQELHLTISFNEADGD